MAILARGVREGEIRNEVEPEGIARLLAGPLMSAMVVGGPSAVESDVVRGNVDVIVDGIGAPSARPRGRSATT